MVQQIPSDTHVVNDPGHTTDHNNIADTLGLICQLLGQGAGPSGIPFSSSQPGTTQNAAAIAAMQAIASWPAAAGTYAPWQFPVSAYGAVGNGKVISDGAMALGSSTLTSTAQAQFSQADAGKNIVVSAAGGSTSAGYYNIPMAGTIVSVQSSTAVTLSFSATAATPTGGVIVGYATDDTVAIQNAINAAVTYAQSSAHQGTYAEVVFDPLVYGVAGNPVLSGTTYGNAQLTLPVIAPTAEKVILVFTGRTKAMDQALSHWSQTTPESTGSVLMSLNLTGTNNNYGPIIAPASMIGGPYYKAGASNPGPTFGGDLGLFSNMMPVVDGIQLLIPYNAPMGGFDFYGCAEATVVNASVMAMAVVNIGLNGSGAAVFQTPAVYPNMYGAGNVNQAFGYNQLTNAWPSGLTMPTTGNNDRCDVLYYSCEGMYYGICPSEHASIDTVRVIYCYYGIGALSGNGVSMPHAARIKYVSCEGSAAAVAPVTGSGTVNLDIDTLDAESAGVIVDPTNLINGTFGLRNLGGASNLGYMNTTQTPNGGTGVKIVCLDNAAIAGVITAVTSPTGTQVGIPVTTVPQQNRFYRDAMVYVTSSSAISAVSIDSTSMPITTAAAGTVAIPVPSGHSFTVTSGGTLSAKWVLF